MKQILCLPIAGIENPYQYLMMKGLKCDSIEVKHGNGNKFYGYLISAFSGADFLHFDWIHQYYLRRTHWMTIIWFPIYVLQIIIVSWFSKIKIVWTVHNIYPHDTPHNGLYKIARKLFGKACYRIRVFDAITAEKLKHEFGFSKSKIVIIPEGDYSEYYPNEVSKIQARDYLGLNRDDFVFLFLGFIRPYKGLEQLIDAFKLLNNPNSKLIIAGRIKDQEYFESLDLQNDNIIVFDKFIPNNELQYFYKATNVVILPFKKIENSGSVIMAMGFEKAVIAPKLGVINSRLKEQKELLFENNLFEIMQLAMYLNTRKLDNIGIMNKKSLSSASWEDFQVIFED